MNEPLGPEGELFCLECAGPIKKDFTICPSCGTEIKKIGKESVVKTEYNIGDTGPAGGLVFYINPNYKNDGWRYLEAAAVDFTGDSDNYWIKWCNGVHINTEATGTAIGMGMSNTLKIVSIQGEGSYAASLCYGLTQGGCCDWFLPSRDELNLMHKSLHLKGMGGFGSDYYWSSSEVDKDLAWYQYFTVGVMDANGNKSYNVRVRALRAFS